MALVLYGDVPLIAVPTLRAWLEQAAGRERLALLTVDMDDPSGYGRVIRDDAGRVIRIVEEKDATPPSARCARSIPGAGRAGGTMLAWLGRLTNDNAQGEYYLTDIIGMAVEGGSRW